MDRSRATALSAWLMILGALGVRDRLRCDKHDVFDRHCFLDVSTLGIDDSENGRRRDDRNRPLCADGRELRPQATGCRGA